MFKFLKDKLKGAISKIVEKIKRAPEEETKELEEEQIKPELKEIKEEIEEEPKKEVKKEELKKEKPKKEEFKPEIKKEEIKPKEKIKKEKPEIKKLKPKEEAKEELAKEEIIEEVKEIQREIKEEAEKEVAEEAPKITAEQAKEEAEKEEVEEIIGKIPQVEEFEEKIKEEEEELEAEEGKKKKWFFQKITERILTTKINEQQFEKFFWDMELALMENNVAIEVIEKIKNDLKKDLVEKPISRAAIAKTIQKSLNQSLDDLFKKSEINILKEINKKKPYVICFVGINGSGKTTTIAKIAKMLLDNKKTVVLAAADTFRAAAIDQLEEHGRRLGVKVIKHNYGADPAAVAYDTIKHAEAKKIDAVLIDTAGRMHSNTNLTDEMKKIIRVAKPDLKIFVGESITGNDCIEQAKTFDEAINIDGIILAKADVDEKGGAAVSISYVTGKPILYLGTGQNYEDLKEFDPKIIIGSLGLGG